MEATQQFPEGIRKFSIISYLKVYWFLTKSTKVN